MRFALVLAALAACTPRPPSITGELDMIGVPDGDWSIAPDACSEGLDFFGIDATDGRASAVLTETAPGVYQLGISVAFAQDGAHRDGQIDSTTCTALSAQLHVGYLTVRRATEVIYGDLAVDCAWPTGGRITGGLHYHGCPCS